MPPSPKMGGAEGGGGSSGAVRRGGSNTFDLRRNAMIAAGVAESGGHAQGSEELARGNENMKRMNRTDSHERLAVNGSSRVSGNQTIAYSKGRRHGETEDNMRYYTSGLTPSGSPFCSSNDLFRGGSQGVEMDPVVDTQEHHQEHVFPHHEGVEAFHPCAPPATTDAGTEDSGMRHSDSSASLSMGLVDLSGLLANDDDAFGGRFLAGSDGSGVASFLNQRLPSDTDSLGWIDQ